MRVLHLTRDLWPRANGGLSTAVHGMVRALEGAGVHCAVLSFDAWRPHARAGGAAALSVEGAVARLSAAPQLDAALAWGRAFGADLVHVHDAMLWELAGKVAGTAPAVVTAHVIHAEMNRLRGLEGGTLSLEAQTRAFAEAAAVLAPSTAAAACLRRHHPGCAVRITPLGVDDDDAARAAVGRPRAPIALAVGRFADVKGTDTLLALAPRVLAAVPEATVVVAGGLPDNPKAERRWRRRFGTVERVRLTGWLDRPALAAAYAEARVLLAPSRFETFGQAPLEAMLHGVPVVAAAVGALPEHVDGAVGALTEPGDLDALAAATVRLLRDPEAARRLGAAAAARVRARHLWPAALPPLLDAYRALCG